MEYVNIDSFTRVLQIKYHPKKVRQVIRRLTQAIKRKQFGKAIELVKSYEARASYQGGGATDRPISRRVIGTGSLAIFRTPSDMGLLREIVESIIPEPYSIDCVFCHLDIDEFNSGTYGIIYTANRTAVGVLCGRHTYDGPRNRVRIEAIINNPDGNRESRGSSCYCCNDDYSDDDEDDWFLAE